MRCPHCKSVDSFVMIRLHPFSDAWSIVSIDDRIIYDSSKEDIYDIDFLLCEVCYEAIS